MMELELLESGVGHVYSDVHSYSVCTRDIYKGKGKDMVLVKGLTKHIHAVEITGCPHWRVCEWSGEWVGVSVFIPLR